ncbi:hypothetical protein JCM8547_005751 [Rhodosporidiobolus lusitaniae]
MKLVFSIFLVLLGGVFSGLSLGLMGLDATNLQVLATSGPPSTRRDAQKVLNLLSNGRHFVLCTLLLSNVVVNETLPVFLDTLTGGSDGGLLAIVISSALIVIFGEVLPQAVCARHGLKVGAKCVGFVRALMYLESPICYPTAKLLDALLGTHSSTLYRREELKTLISLHATSSSSSYTPTSGDGYAPVDELPSGGGGGLAEAEVELVGKVLGMAEKTVEDAMRELKELRGRRGETYVVSDGMRLCEVDWKKLLVCHHQYIPVKRSKGFSGAEKPEQFVGFLRVEQVLDAPSRPNDLIRTLPLSPLVQVLPQTSLVECVAYLRNESPGAVLLVAGEAEEPKEGDEGQKPLSAHAPLGFLTLKDLALLLVQPSAASSPSASPTVSFAPTVTRTSVTRPRSSSIGLRGFVQGLVDRQLAHSAGKARGHRASSSQLSFRLSSSEEENENDNDLSHPHHPARPYFSHSHHRTTSASSLSSLVRGSAASHHAFLPPSVSRHSNGPSPSPVLKEDAEAFELGVYSDEDDDSTSVRSGRKRGEGDDSGFVEREGEGEGSVLFEFGEGRDPLGAGSGKGGGGGG